VCAIRGNTPGPLTSSLHQHIRDIQYGRETDTNGWIVEVPV
jgi:hypothetical protein